LWGGFEFPEDVAEEAEPMVDVGLGEGQVAHEAADFFFRGGVAGVAAEGEDFEEEDGQAFALLCCGEGFFGLIFEKAFGDGGGGFFAGLADELI
jgi:hypothetical protein